MTPGPGVRSYLQQLSVYFPDELLVAHNQRDKRYFELFRIDAVTGESTLIEANDRFTGFFTDPQFKVRFGHCQTRGRRPRLSAAQCQANGSCSRASTSRTPCTTRPIEFSDDGKELYWLDLRGATRRRSWRRTWRAGPCASLPKTRGRIFPTLIQTPVSLSPLAASSTYLRRGWRVLDAAYADDFAAIAKLSDGDALIGAACPPTCATGSSMSSAMPRPGQFFHYDRAAKKGRLLFVTRPALQEAPLVPMQPVVVTPRDGLDLVCYLSRPREARAGTPTPMVLLVHGGPWGRDIWALYTAHQWLANRGYAVLSVNFRGSTGFGKAFVNAANLEWGAKTHDDLIDAVDWAIAQKIADPQRVAIYGASYGGYAALVGVTFTPEKFACAIDVFGISNLTTMMTTIPEYWKPVQTIWKARMGDYTTEAGRKLLQERSPLNRIDRISRPLLIAQGANDVRVKPSESDQIVTAMRSTACRSPTSTTPTKATASSGWRTAVRSTRSPSPSSASISAGGPSRSATTLRARPSSSRPAGT